MVLNRKPLTFHNMLTLLLLQHARILAEKVSQRLIV